MKNCFVLFVLVLGLQFSNAQNLTSSKIKEVTIYQNQGQIERTAKVALKKGENKISFVNLEKDILQQSIMISAGDQVTVLSNYLEALTIDKLAQPKNIKNLLDEIEIVSRDRYLIRQKIQNLREEKQVVLHNKNALGDSGFDLQKIQGLTAFYRKNLNDIDKLIYDDEQSMKSFDEKLQKLNKQLNDEGYRQQANAITSSIISDKDQEITVKLNYVVYNVGWSPFYDIKSDGVNPLNKIIYKANIFQNTGVNWEGINVKLSTAQPLTNQSVPKVHPWVLRFYEEVSKSRSPQMMAQSNRAYDLAEVEVASYKKEMSQQISTAVDNITSREFTINLPLTISGKDGKNVIELDSYEIEGTYQYFAVPKYNPNVFLTAYLTDWEKYNLLPGTANLYLAKDYVGTTFINPNQDSDSLQLPLGKDAGVVIKRERINDVTNRSFIGRFKTVEMGVQIVVKNNKSVPISITVEDQVPISSNSDIEVSVNEISDGKINAKTGTVSWDLKLAPKETKTLIIRYEVKYPKNKKLANF